jgi:hypothetical protein
MPEEPEEPKDEMGAKTSAEGDVRSLLSVALYRPGGISAAG